MGSTKTQIFNFLKEDELERKFVKKNIIKYSPINIKKAI